MMEKIKNLDEIMRKSREFLAKEVGYAYIVIACVNEWQKETGGTLDELLEHLGKDYSKKTDLADFLAEHGLGEA